MSKMPFPNIWDICCRTCIKNESDKCPVKTADNWSENYDFCSKWENDKEQVICKGDLYNES